MVLLGIDLGTSFIKVSAVDAETRQLIGSVQYPETEMEIISPQPGWAEQSADMWWEYTIVAICKLLGKGNFSAPDLVGIGISYQMHGLVLVDSSQRLLRNVIIWCDNRATTRGENACVSTGEDFCSAHLLNKPGNFTASKLAWIKENEPNIYSRIDKIMLPGDYICMKLTGEVSTTPSALSEAILWDFQREGISAEVMNAFGFDFSMIPPIRNVFSPHGKILANIAHQLKIPESTVVTYKAGDQLNNALSLNVTKPGQVAANAGTSGVIYAVTNKLVSDKQSRINCFLHPNHLVNDKRIGVLVCINSAGMIYSWLRRLMGGEITYKEMDRLASTIPQGSEGLFILPFGNGSERMFGLAQIQGQILNIDLNKHTRAHLLRAVQEGIAFAFRYGFDIMREHGITASVVRAGYANLFKSEVFIESFVNITGSQLELFAMDGSVGAALGAGVGGGVYKTCDEAFGQREPVAVYSPETTSIFESRYIEWKRLLKNFVF